VYASGAFALQHPESHPNGEALKYMLTFTSCSRRFTVFCLIASFFGAGCMSGVSLKDGCSWLSATDVAAVLGTAELTAEKIVAGDVRRGCRYLTPEGRLVFQVIDDAATVDAWVTGVRNIYPTDRAPRITLDSSVGDGSARIEAQNMHALYVRIGERGYLLSDLATTTSFDNISALAAILVRTLR
jgi:hypothetical protein